ncbi:MAG: hemagglutinin, partial [Gammaproteobacteria bacterium]|nr:hemagglutinin [Gammaproteobacteria bacterium]
MNRIFRLVWSHRLNALVVVSEIATARGSLAAGPVVVHLKVPMSVLSLGLSLALCTGSAWAGENQTLTDLQALTAKYTAPLPVKLDAEVALAAAARDRGTAPLLSVDAKVNLNLGTPTAQRPALQVHAAAQANADLPRRVGAPGAQGAALADLGIAAGTGNGARLNAHADIDAVAAVAPTPATVRVPVKAEAKAAAGVAVAATPSPRKVALEANVDAAAQARLAAAEVQAKAALIAEATVTPDAPDAVQASLASNVAGGVRVDAVGHRVDAADRNPKRVDAGVSAVQTSSMALAPNGLGNALGGLLNGVGGAVGGLLDGVGTTVGAITTPVLGAVGAITTPILGTVFPAPTSLPPGSPKGPAPADPNAGLVIGTAGLVGSLSQLVGPTAQGLLGGDGYVRNGNLSVSSANVMQTYSVTNVLGLPVVNLTPVGTLLDGLGNASTGGSSHLTLIGGVTSDSYIYNINNGNPNGLLGLLLPDGSPAWSNTCVNLLVASVDCWAVNAAQDYQVLVGDGAFANGSKEVVIGANARHELPRQDANVAFPGVGLNDPTDPTGVPTADYAARMGHSVVVGDSATGTANGQTILGAEATSNQANSVALGYRSAANRGAQASYSAYGLNGQQVSAGEVSVGFAGGERQISNVAAGSAA